MTVLAAPGRTAPPRHVTSRPTLPVTGAALLLSACGLLLISLSYDDARAEDGATGPAFWLGLVLLFAPLTGVLLRADLPRPSRVALVAALGGGVYLVKVLHSPTAFTLHDELAHLRTAQDIAETGQAFRENPLLPITSRYPGLELVTTSLSDVTGLSLFSSGLLLLLVGRVLLVVGVFLLGEHLCRSARLAGIGAALYATGPGFIYFTAQYSYESLALPLSVLTALAAVRAVESGELRWRALSYLAASAVVMTHHVTSYALLLFLAGWTLVSMRARERRAPWRLLVWTSCLVALWATTVAPVTYEYLEPHLSGGVDELFEVFRGTGEPRELYTSGGVAAPLWERVLGTAATVSVVLAIPVAGYLFLRPRHGDALCRAAVAAALLYPPSVLLRLTSAGQESAARAPDFLYAAIGPVLAGGLLAGLLRRRGGVSARVVVTSAVTLLFLGGVIVGWAPYARAPGPYRVAAGPRSIEPESIRVASWTRSALGRDRRFATDRSNSLLIGTYGAQHPVTAVADDVGVWPVYLEPVLGGAAIDTIRRGRIDFVQLDRRLGTGQPLDGVYFERGEPDDATMTTPAILKFDTSSLVSRIYDSGNIQIYDVRGLR